MPILPNKAASQTPVASSSSSEKRPDGDVVRSADRVELRRHVPGNQEAFQHWYGDPEIAYLLRHDLDPLSEKRSRSYFTSLILPLSARGQCWAIHERSTGRLIGTTALTDMTVSTRSALFRIVIGEKDFWGRGFGTEATRLVCEEAFTNLGLRQIKLEVFRHNERGIATYIRVGFRHTGEHSEWLPRRQMNLEVLDMTLDSADYWSIGVNVSVSTKDMT